MEPIVFQDRLVQLVEEFCPNRITKTYTSNIYVGADGKRGGRTYFWSQDTVKLKVFHDWLIDTADWVEVVEFLPETWECWATISVKEKE